MARIKVQQPSTYLVWLFLLFEIAVCRQSTASMETTKNTENSTHLVICKLSLTTGTITTYQRASEQRSVHCCVEAPKFTFLMCVKIIRWNRFFIRRRAFFPDFTISIAQWLKFTVDKHTNKPNIYYGWIGRSPWYVLSTHGLPTERKIDCWRLHLWWNRRDMTKIWIEKSAMILSSYVFITSIVQRFFSGNGKTRNVISEGACL